MARKIAGDAGAPALVELARRIAEAEIDALRVRRIRSAIISRFHVYRMKFLKSN